MFSKIKLIHKEIFYVWLTLLFLIGQWIIVALNTVNIPQGDEWDSLTQNALPSGFTFNYLFGFHNEHRLVFTNLVNYFFFVVSDWNAQYQVIFNYIIFSSLVIFLMRFQKKHIPSASKAIWILPFFLTSPLLVDNHVVGIQSVFHFCLLFGVISVFYATREKLRTADVWISAVGGLCAVYSLAAGMFFALTSFLVLGYRLFIEPKNSWQEMTLKGLALLGIVMGVGAWFVGFHSPAGHPPLTWPHDTEFWYFLANLISLGFGFKTSNGLLAFVALGIVIFTLGRSFKKAFSFKDQYFSLAFFGSLAVIAALGSIALSRAGFGIGQAKTSRYAEISILLVPFMGWLLWGLSLQSLKYKKAIKYYIWFLFIGFAGDFSYSRYFTVAQERRDSLECISKYYRGENKTAYCPLSYPVSMVEILENAKKLKLSFVVPL
ncbi:MAG: hypothetical protein ACXVB1_13730 [Pseudobdellovibrionaceae bacterium]